jgi:dipicolinate synthase subunit A
MEELTFYPLERTPALVSACMYLEEQGVRVSSCGDNTVTHLLLPIPKFDSHGLAELRCRLRNDITLVGGNLSEGIDLLRDPHYLAENAAITADCAIRLAGQGLKTVFRGLPVLIIGLARIGKCLASQLHGMGAQVTVAARKETDRGTLASLGYHAISTDALETHLPHSRIIFNTVPCEMITEAQSQLCRRDCLKIDLASNRGIAGDGVLWARGLPGKMAPEAAGRLIGSAALRLARKEAAK